MLFFLCYTEEVGILDLVFPKRCVGCKRIGLYICPDCFSRISFSTASSFCLVCNKLSKNGFTHPHCVSSYSIDGCFIGLSYSGIIRRALRAYKSQSYISGLSSHLGELLYEGLIQNEFFYSVFSGKCIFVPIPLYKTDERKRGYNQVLLLSRDLSKRLGVKTLPLLERVRKTRQQYGLLKAERFKNVKDAFAVKRILKLPDTSTTIFIVDDLVTSGATLLSAAEVLKKSGYQSVYGVVLANEKEKPRFVSGV